LFANPLNLVVLRKEKGFGSPGRIDSRARKSYIRSTFLFVENSVRAFMYAITHGMVRVPVAFENFHPQLLEWPLIPHAERHARSLDTWSFSTFNQALCLGDEGLTFRVLVCVNEEVHQNIRER